MPEHDMATIWPYVITCAVLFVSSFARAALGFGDALIAMPLLTLAIGLKVAAPLVALVATTIAAIILWQHWQAVEFKAAARLISAALLGVPLGLLLLRSIPESVMQACLGGVLMTFSVYSLVQPHVVIREDRGVLAYGCGFGAGVLGGAYNIVGPLLVVYGQLRRWAPQRFRVTLQSCFLPAYCGIVVGHGLAGALSGQVLGMYGMALPLVLLAIFLGGKVHMALDRERFGRAVNLALLLIGGVLCLRSFIA